MKDSATQVIQRVMAQEERTIEELTRSIERRQQVVNVRLESKNDMATVFCMKQLLGLEAQKEQARHRYSQLKGIAMEVWASSTPVDYLGQIARILDAPVPPVDVYQNEQVLEEARSRLREASSLRQQGTRAA